MSTPPACSPPTTAPTRTPPERSAAHADPARTVGVLPFLHLEEAPAVVEASRRRVQRLHLQRERRFAMRLDVIEQRRPDPPTVRRWLDIERVEVRLRPIEGGEADEAAAVDSDEDLFLSGLLKELAARVADVEPGEGRAHDTLVEVGAGLELVRVRLANDQAHACMVQPSTPMAAWRM